MTIHAELLDAANAHAAFAELLSAKGLDPAPLGFIGANPLTADQARDVAVRRAGGPFYGQGVVLPVATFEAARTPSATLFDQPSATDTMTTRWMVAIVTLD